jgi:hypothetical protein
MRVWAALVLLLAPWLYVASLAFHASEQRRAIDAITRLNGYCEYDFEFRSHSVFGSLPPAPSNASPPAPPWLVRLVGTDYFANIALFSVPIRPSGKEWDELSRLSDLEYVHLRYTVGTDDDLARLAEYSNLKRALVHFEVSEQAIGKLHKALPKLCEVRAPLVGGRYYVFDARLTPAVTIYPPPKTSLPANSAKASATSK